MEIKGEKDTKYWDKRKTSGIRSIGRNMNLESPEQLWGLACDYFKDCDSTPWVKTDYKGKDAMEVQIPTTAPYLWSGFDSYLFSQGICTTLKDYRTASRKPKGEQGIYAPFSEVITHIDNIMVTQKVSGAMVGAYNSNLVARLEGLADKTETEVSVIKETKIGFE